ncbi:MAG: hypothetical protein HON43_05330 [Alphaproteobacteria bacterium]|nr:hypothetical protein [Alphaproteobacteria bacterium]
MKSTTKVSLVPWHIDGGERLVEAWEHLVPGQRTCDKVHYLRGIHEYLDEEYRRLKPDTEFKKTKQVICRVEDEEYLKRYTDSFFYSSLSYLTSTCHPLQFNGERESAKEVIVNKNALLQLGNRILCSCGSGFPCNKTEWSDSLGVFKEGLRLKCSSPECKGEYFPLYQVDGEGNSMTEKVILGSTHLSGAKNAQTKRFISLMRGENFNWRKHTVKAVRLAMSKVVEEDAADSIKAALLEWSDTDSQVQFDVGFDRREMTGANNGANGACGIMMSSDSRKVVGVSFFNKKILNENRLEDQPIATSKSLDTKSSIKAFEFLNRVLKTKNRASQRPQQLSISTDKANRATAGLLKTHVTDVGHSWNWCIWHERKSVNKFVTKYFSMGNKDMKVNLNKDAIKGLFLEQGWSLPLPDEAGKSPPLSKYRDLLLEHLKTEKFVFKTKLVTQEVAQEFAKMPSQDERNAWLAEQDAAAEIITKMEPTKEEAKRMWWTGWKTVIYRDCKTESEDCGVSEWIGPLEEVSTQRAKTKTILVPEWMIQNLARFQRKICQHVYMCSTKAAKAGNSEEERARSMYKEWHNFVPHHKHGGNRKRSIEALGHWEARAMNAFFHHTHFSYHNWFKFMCAGATTSWCENFFSTWGKHGRDKALKNEDWYLLTTILRNVIETNAREDARHCCSKFDPFDIWNATLGKALVADTSQFSIREFERNNMGILFDGILTTAMNEKFPVIDNQGIPAIIGDEAFEDLQEEQNVEDGEEEEEEGPDEDEDTLRDEEGVEAENGILFETSIHGRRRIKQDYRGLSGQKRKRC